MVADMIISHVFLYVGHISHLVPKWEPVVISERGDTRHHASPPDRCEWAASGWHGAAAEFNQERTKCPPHCFDNEKKKVKTT